MPYLWRFGMVLLVVCLVASMAIAVVRLSTTPEEIMGDRFHGLPHAFIEEHRQEYGARQ
ncbi:MAG TPA: hypothetical protein VHB53_13530 [Solirubrobacterales bacterium]|nr:hypothetical protein [Solirubrobacterales bacterium]